MMSWLLLCFDSFVILTRVSRLICCLLVKRVRLGTRDAHSQTGSRQKTLVHKSITPFLASSISLQYSSKVGQFERTPQSLECSHDQEDNEKGARSSRCVSLSSLVGRGSSVRKDRLTEKGVACLRKVTQVSQTGCSFLTDHKINSSCVYMPSKCRRSGNARVFPDLRSVWIRVGVSGLFLLLPAVIGVLLRVGVMRKTDDGVKRALRTSAV